MFGTQTGERNHAKNVVTASEVFHFFSRHEQFTHPEINLFDLVSSPDEGLERSRRLLGRAKRSDRKSVVWNFPRSYTKMMELEDQALLISRSLTFLSLSAVILIYVSS